MGGRAIGIGTCPESQCVPLGSESSIHFGNTSRTLILFFKQKIRYLLPRPYPRPFLTLVLL